jgi:hypothetical protein
LLLPGSALAKKKHNKAPKPLGPVETVTESGFAGDGETATASATCPAGTVVVGGGFTTPPVASGQGIIVLSSFRSSPVDWTVSGVVSGDRKAITAHGYCRNTRGRAITDVSTSATVSRAGQVTSLTSSCPSGKLIAGGFESTRAQLQGHMLWPQASWATSSSAWTVTVLPIEAGDRTLTAHAYCMARIKQPAIVSQTSSGAPGQLGTVESNSPSCPSTKNKKAKKKGKKRRKRKVRPKQLSAGGFAVPLDLTPEAPLLVITDSRIGTGGTWLAKATNRSLGSTPPSITSQGICL